MMAKKLSPTVMLVYNEIQSGLEKLPSKLQSWQNGSKHRIFGGLVPKYRLFQSWLQGCAPPSRRRPDLCDSGIMALVVAHTARIFILYICSPWHNVPLYIACMLLEWRLLRRESVASAATLETETTSSTDGWIVSGVVGVSHWEKIYEYEFVVLTLQGDAATRHPALGGFPPIPASIFPPPSCLDCFCNLIDYP